jgi:hypothetical protein
MMRRRKFSHAPRAGRDEDIFILAELSPVRHANGAAAWLFGDGVTFGLWVGTVKSEK